MATVEMLARDDPLAAVRRARIIAGAEEARFQLPRLAAVDLSREAPDKRELVRDWMERLRAYVPELKFADIARVPRGRLYAAHKAAASPKDGSPP